jgi:hypothetical protein
MIGTATQNVKSQLDALTVIQAIRKLTLTHDNYITHYPELDVLVSAVMGEVQVDEPGEDDKLLLRLLHIIKVLNAAATHSAMLADLRQMFMEDIVGQFSEAPFYTINPRQIRDTLSA